MSNNRFRSLALPVMLCGPLALGLIAGLSHVATTRGDAQLVGEGPKPIMASNSAPNIILVVVDALRADHVSSYGYARPTTPNLDALVVSQGVSFNNATTASAWTFPSNAAMLTGRSPASLGIEWSNPASTVSASETLLAEYLHGAGYYTAGFIAAYYVKSSFGFSQGFDVYRERLGGGANPIRASTLNQIAIDWLDNTWAPVLSGTQPLFLFLYYFDPHTWYDPSPPYDTLYDSTYTGTLTADVFRDGQGVVSGAIVPSTRDVEHLIALYDGEITYWDDHFGQLMLHLDNLGLLDKSIVIVTSDHGEMFGEHDKWTHRNSLYEEALRVPLAIRYTGVITPGLVVTVPVQTTDLTPTILDWLDLPLAPHLTGRSLTGLAQGEPVTTMRDIFSEMDAITDPTVPGYWLAPRYESRSIRRADWKYIHYINLTANELYQLQPASQYETQNLSLIEPETATLLFQELISHFGLLTRYIYLPVSLK